MITHCYLPVLESPGCCGEGPEDDHQHPEDGPQARGFPQRSLCQEAGKRVHLLRDIMDIGMTRTIYHCSSGKPVFRAYRTYLPMNLSSRKQNFWIWVLVLDSGLDPDPGSWAPLINLGPDPGSGSDAQLGLAKKGKSYLIFKNNILPVLWILWVISSITSNII
jgi:hypothetical protein